MFLRFWILWAFVGLSIATAIFWWALHRGQFEDSRRAALLPLDDVDEPVEDRSTRAHARAGRWHLVELLGVVAIGVAFVVVTIVLALKG